jgi:hypothetical protein
MKKTIALVAVCLSLMACNNEPSLQKYFVENTENANFIAMDVSPSILNIDPTKLTVDQKETLKSFKKINILAFKLNGKNQAMFTEERSKVAAILKNKTYQPLMKFGSGKEGASISFVGSEDHIEEFIVFANKKENGFALVRILGKDMNPNGIMSMMSILQTANVNLDQLKPLEAMFKK